jgi:hypothetical protein
MDVRVNYDNWSVRLEAEVKDPSGRPTHIVAEGMIDDLGSYRRKLVGSWTEGAAKGDFKLTRE